MIQIPLTSVKVSENYCLDCDDHVVHVKKGNVSFELFCEIIPEGGSSYPCDYIRFFIKLADSEGRILSLATDIEVEQFFDLLLNSTSVFNRYRWKSAPDNLKDVFQKNTFLNNFHSIDDSREIHMLSLSDADKHSKKCLHYLKPYYCYRKHLHAHLTFSIIPKDDDSDIPYEGVLLLLCEKLSVENPNIIDEDGYAEMEDIDFLFINRGFPFGFLQQLNCKDYTLEITEERREPQKNVILR